MPNLCKAWIFGSPPRLWGKLAYLLYLCGRYRFTPTLVGKTMANSHRLPAQKVHPHACGENLVASNSTSTAAGSPPRLWGKLRHFPRYRQSYRFTPTLVGKTFQLLCVEITALVHPHACGENGLPSGPSAWINGSPPRLWGKRVHQTDFVGGHRFTPTLVGKTPRFLYRVSARSVHPHACGENKKQIQPVSGKHGSPPRLWGKRRGKRGFQRLQRFTPTLVGKTPDCQDSPSSRTVHPHACGENLCAAALILSGIGSPPRLWGKPHPSASRPVGPRFTPTLVGKTLCVKG